MECSCSSASQTRNEGWTRETFLSWRWWPMVPKLLTSRNHCCLWSILQVLCPGPLLVPICELCSTCSVFFSCPSLLVYIDSSAWAPDETKQNPNTSCTTLTPRHSGPLFSPCRALSPARFSPSFQFGVEVPVHPPWSHTLPWHLHSISMGPSASHTTVSSCGCRPLRAMCLSLSFLCRQKSFFLSASAQLLHTPATPAPNSESWLERPCRVNLTAFFVARCWPSSAPSLLHPTWLRLPALPRSRCPP